MSNIGSSVSVVVFGLALWLLSVVIPFSRGQEEGPAVVAAAPAPTGIVAGGDQYTGGMDLGKLETWDEFNDVTSEMITIMNPKQLMIRKFEYNGDGPAAWFMVGKEKDDYNEEFANLDGVLIPDEEGSCDRLGEYKGEDIMLTLPGDMKFTDYDYISVYCIRFSHNFGYVRIKRDEAQQFPFRPTPNYLKAATNTTELEECDQEPEPRGENCGRNCDDERRRRRRRRKSLRY